MGVHMSVRYAALLIIAAFTSMAYAAPTVVTINDPAISEGYYPSYYTNPTTASSTTHIIAVYETRSDHSGMNHPVGTAHVHIGDGISSSFNLVLSSYEPTQWIIDGEGASYVRSVLISSYSGSSVSGIDPVKVQETYMGSSPYVWANAASFASKVEALIGSPVSTFSGVYRATDFSVSSPVPEPSTLILMLSSIAIGISVRHAQRMRNGLPLRSPA
ncbi:MAG: PEP-CTERM sorting domain-containing protein [Chitinophagaceae bacterium]|nr:MAG: PEP-CTERM sorting domain-containing protein [Chitinophagaceae bacterium]